MNKSKTTITWRWVRILLAILAVGSIQVVFSFSTAAPASADCIPGMPTPGCGDASAPAATAVDASGSRKGVDVPLCITAADPQACTQLESDVARNDQSTCGFRGDQAAIQACLNAAPQPAANIASNSAQGGSAAPGGAAPLNKDLPPVTQPTADQALNKYNNQLSKDCQSGNNPAACNAQIAARPDPGAAASYAGGTPVPATFNTANILKLSGWLEWMALIACIVGIFVSSSLWALGSKGQNPGQELTGKKGLILCCTAAFFVGALPGMLTWLDGQAKQADITGVTGSNSPGGAAANTGPKAAAAAPIAAVAPAGNAQCKGVVLNNAPAWLCSSDKGFDGTGNTNCRQGAGNGNAETIWTCTGATAPAPTTNARVNPAAAPGAAAPDPANNPADNTKCNALQATKQDTSGNPVKVTEWLCKAGSNFNGAAHPDCKMGNDDLFKQIWTCTGTYTATHAALRLPSEAAESGNPASKNNDSVSSDVHSAEAYSRS